MIVKKVADNVFSTNGLAWIMLYLAKLFKVERLISDRHYLQLLSWCLLGYRIDLNNPKTFNEKMQWLKLYDRKPLYHQIVDKGRVKEYVSNIIGDEYIIPTYGVWDRVEDVLWNDLPNQFVIKTTGGSGGNDVIICKDKTKLDKEASGLLLQKSLLKDAYWYGREECYHKNKNRIIAEKLLMDSSDKVPVDYKFMCFNGSVKCSFTCTNRYSDSGMNVTFYDRNWKIMPFERSHPHDDKPIKKPENYELMIALAERLSVNIPFVRVDFYDVDGKVYFGELTLYPGSGFESFQPKEWDLILGSWLKV